MKIPFDIKYRKEIESGEYQLMSGDKKARIICWDARGYEVTHIVALVGNDGQPENILRFYKNGELISDSSRQRTKDLYIITSPNEDNFTDFETKLYAVCKASSFITFNCNTIKKWAAELLELAKKEIMGEYQYIYANGLEAGTILRDDIVVSDEPMNEYETRLCDLFSGFTIFGKRTIKKLVKAIAPSVLSESGRELDRRYHERLPMWEQIDARPSSIWGNMYHTSADGYLYAPGKRIKLSEIESLPMKDE